jgi:hypothetical protein
MTKSPAIRKLWAGFLMLTGSVTQAFAQTPSPDTMLDAKLAPKMDDVNISVPDDVKSCKVELVKGSTAGSSGWLLKDAKGQTLRRFFDTNGDNKVDLWSYYKDGVEVYREFDTQFKGSPDNFRWLNGGGMKWGIGAVDARGKGQIRAWRMISAEEVGYEAFQAAAKQDYARMHVLFITESELQGLKLPTAKVKAVQAVLQQAQKKFADLGKAANLSGARFDGVESAVPQCDTTQDVEIIRFASRPIRYEQNKKLEFIHTGEMIQVGMTWRLVDVLSDKDGGGASGPNNPNPMPGNPALDKLLQLLADLDVKTPQPKGVLDKDAKVDMYYRTRIALIQEILQLENANQREGWYKQLFDNLMAMAQNSGDPAHIALLSKMKDDVIKTMPNSNLAAYGAYRDMWNRFSIAMAKPGNTQKDIQELQDKWLVDLSGFVSKYAKAEDTPEALHQLAIGSEFGGKAEEAKRWYKQLYGNFPDHHLAPRARGSETRLSLVGTAPQITSPMLYDKTKTFDITSLKGKVVIVHYWGSYTEQYKDDFVRLKRIVEQNSKNVELVCINLDETAARAQDAVAKATAPGIHLFHVTNKDVGLNGPLANQFGIHILPTIFVIGRDGRVTNNMVQIGDIETELKKVQ